MDTFKRATEISNLLIMFFVQVILLTIEPNEKQRRLILSITAIFLGRGGISRVSSHLSVSRTTIASGIKELCQIKQDVDKDGKNVKELNANENGKEEKELNADENGKEKKKSKTPTRIRKPGGGRKSVEQKQPRLEDALLRLVDPSSYGNPENPLKWKEMSLNNIAQELHRQGLIISASTVGRVLKDKGFSLQQNRKLLQVGPKHPDRNAQFENINSLQKIFIRNGWSIVSMDCKKKELIGYYFNKGRIFVRKKCAIKVNDHDFVTSSNTVVAPYGIYDIIRNTGFINLGISHDTAEFAVHSLYSWWMLEGKYNYPKSKCLLILADGGGSNSSRSRLWKLELQKFANMTGLTVFVSHYPPGTSKWNKIEHRLFSMISRNWKSKPLTSIKKVVRLIRKTKTKTGLRVKCVVDKNEYKTGIKVSQEEMNSLSLERANFHGDWNYSMRPQIA